MSVFQIPIHNVHSCTYCLSWRWRWVDSCWSCSCNSTLFLGRSSVHLL